MDTSKDPTSPGMSKSTYSKPDESFQSNNTPPRVFLPSNPKRPKPVPAYNGTPAYAARMERERKEAEKKQQQMQKEQEQRQRRQIQDWENEAVIARNYFARGTHDHTSNAQQQLIIAEALEQHEHSWFRLVRIVLTQLPHPNQQKRVSMDSLKGGSIQKQWKSLMTVCLLQ